MRTRRSLTNLGAALAATAITTVASLVSLPYLVAWLGDETFGAIRVARDWFAYLAILEIGISGGLLPVLARRAATSDASATHAAVASGVHAYKRITLWTIALGVILVWALPPLVGVSPEATTDLRIGGGIAVVGLLALPLTPLRSLLDAMQRSHLVHVAVLAQSITTIALSLLAAWWALGIAGQFGAVLLGSLPMLGLLVLFASRHCPGVVRVAMVARAEEESTAEITRLNRPTLLYMLFGRLGLAADNVVVALLLGPKAVVPLLITVRLALLAQGALLSVGNAAWAGLAELEATNQIARFNERVIELTRLVTMAATAALVPVAVFTGPFVRAWIGETHFGGTGIAVVASVNGLLMALFSLWGWCFGGTGRLPMLVRAQGAFALVNVVVSVAATHALGAIGPLVGTLAGFVTVSIWYLPYKLHRTFGTSIPALARAVATPLVAGIPVAVLCVLWLDRFPTTTIVGCGFSMAVTGSAYAVVAWSCLFDVAQRRLWQARVHDLLLATRTAMGRASA